MPKLIIDSEISLILVEPDDAETLFALTDANRVYLRRWLPWVDATESVADTKSFINSCVKEADEKLALHFCIRYQGELAGMISFHRFDRANRLTSIGYWLSEHLQNKGIMTRSCRAAADFAFREMGLNRIEIRCAVSNTRSRAIPERLKFVNEGTIRDAEWLYDKYVDLMVYGMLARHWPGQAPK